MSSEYLELGPVPPEEDCAQVGTDDYTEKSRAESKRYVALLEKVFGNPPGGAYFTVKTFQHDFGSYREVVIRFNNENEAESRFAYWVEGNLPATWNDDEKNPMPADFNVSIEPYHDI